MKSKFNYFLFFLLFPFKTPFLQAKEGVSYPQKSSFNALDNSAALTFSKISRFSETDAEKDKENENSEDNDWGGSVGDGSVDKGDPGEPDTPSIPGGGGGGDSLENGGTDEGASDNDNSSISARRSASALVAVNTRAAAVNLWQAEDRALGQRMDSERNGVSDGNSNSVWIGYYGGNRRQKMSGDNSGFKQNSDGFIVGTDRRLAAKRGHVLIGGAFIRGRSDVNMRDEGDMGSSINGYGGTLYTSYRMDNGLFFDASLKGGHVKNDAYITYAHGRSHSNYTTRGTGGFLKTGWRFQNEAAAIEPYARLSAVRYGNLNYRLDNGQRAKDSGYRSLRVEGGVSTSARLNVKNVELRPYFNLSIEGEADGNHRMTIDGVRVKDSDVGREGTVGLGTDIRIAEFINVWVGAQYARGNNMEARWQIGSGISYAW